MAHRHGIWAEQILRGKTQIQADQLRTEVLVRDTFFDEILEHFLQRTFCRTDTDKMVQSLFDYSSDGPLCGLVSKARLAYALGLIDKRTLDDLRNMHVIRNRFAHLPSPDLTDHELAKACKNLSAAKGRIVTAGNYVDIYRATVLKCMEYLRHALDKEVKQLQSRLACEQGK